MEESQEAKTLTQKIKENFYNSTNICINRSSNKICIYK